METSRETIAGAQTSEDSGLDMTELVEIEEAGIFERCLEVKGMGLTDRLGMGMRGKEKSRKTPRFGV